MSIRADTAEISACQKVQTDGRTDRQTAFQLYIVEDNRLKIKELPERKIGENKSKIGSSLLMNWLIARRKMHFYTYYYIATYISMCTHKPYNICTHVNIAT